MKKYRVIQSFTSEINGVKSKGNSGEIVELSDAQHKRLIKGGHVFEHPEPEPIIVYVDRETGEEVPGEPDEKPEDAQAAYEPEPELSTEQEQPKPANVFNGKRSKYKGK